MQNKRKTTIFIPPLDYAKPIRTMASPLRRPVWPWILALIVIWTAGFAMLDQKAAARQTMSTQSIER